MATKNSISLSTFTIVTQIVNKFVADRRVNHQIEIDDANHRIICHVGNKNMVVFKMESGGIYEIATFVGNKNFIMDDVVYEKKSDWVLMNMMAAVTCFFEQILISDLSIYMSGIKDRVYLNSL